MAKKTKLLDDMTLRAAVKKAIKDEREARFLDGGGLVCVVTPAGKARFIHRYEFRGRYPQRWYDGDYPRQISLAQARAEHAADCAMLDDGIDPKEAHASGAVGPTPTVAEYARAHFLRLAPPAQRKMDPDRAPWLRDVTPPQIANIRMDALRASDVEAAVKRFWKDFRPTPSARRVVAAISNLLEHWHANAHQDDDHWNNPVSFKRLAKRLGDRPHYTRPRASLSFRDAPAFLARLQAAPAMSYRVLEWIMLTGCRLREGSGARWGEIDWKARTWTIPPHRLKTEQNKGVDGKAFTIPLSLGMVQVLRRAAERREGVDLGPDDLIFPGRYEGRHLLPYTPATLLQALKRLDPTITVHGFRSTLCAWGVAVPHRNREPFPLELMDQILGHKIGNRRDENSISPALATYANDAGADPFTLRRKIVMREWSAYLRGREAPKKPGATAPVPARAPLRLVVPMAA